MNKTLQRTTLVLALLVPLGAWSQVSLSVTIAPPPLPLYAQPPIPGDGYLWTPGYWSWDPAAGDYEWVPGTWVLPPQPGFLWTPGYWAFSDNGYYWHGGYWGQRVGYYGGLNYGYGYNGSGYYGGRWDGGHFRYNQAVNNLPPGRVHNVYRAPVPARPATRESFNGGSSHYQARPSAGERQIQGAQHAEPTAAQVDHEQRARALPEQRMGNNHGMPPTAATPRPGGFGEAGVEHVRAQPQARGGQPAEPGRPAGGERPQGEPGRANGGNRPDNGGGRQEPGEKH